MTAQTRNVLAFIGSYADSSTPGLYACKYDIETGSLELTDSIDGLQNPTFLDIDPRHLRLYSLFDGNGLEGERCGAAAAFDIDTAAGKLSLLNQEITVSGPTCHITLDRTLQCIMVASYHGGMIGLSPILEDGRVGITADVHQHQGSSVLPVQGQPRPHSVFLDPKNQFAVVSDLGLDQILIYRLDVAAHKMIPHGQVRVAPGAGPRHFAFHPTRPYGYVINELNSTITAFAYDQEAGNLTEIQTVSTLPDSFHGENGCADLHISKDGKFIYGSNRGHDSIAVFAIDESTGKISIVEYAPAGGRHPRNFALSPDDRFLLVANRDTNNIVTLARDSKTGKLQPTGITLEVSKPVCLKFLSL